MHHNWRLIRRGYGGGVEGGAHPHKICKKKRKEEKGREEERKEEEKRERKGGKGLKRGEKT